MPVVHFFMVQKSVNVACIVRVFFISTFYCGAEMIFMDNKATITRVGSRVRHEIDLF